MLYIKTQNNLNLNKFFSAIKLKKQYIKKLKNKINLLNNFKKNYKNLSSVIFNRNNYKNYVKENFLVAYIVDITFSRTNTLLHVMDFSGNLIFFCSAGSLQYKGKRKKNHMGAFIKMSRILVSKFKFLKSQPIALHLKNVKSSKFKITRRLKKKLFIKVVKSYDLYPHNGCRRIKIRKKKIRSKKIRRKFIKKKFIIKKK